MSKANWRDIKGAPFNEWIWVYSQDWKKQFKARRSRDEQDDEVYINWFNEDEVLIDEDPGISHYIPVDEIFPDPPE